MHVLGTLDPEESSLLKVAHRPNLYICHTKLKVVHNKINMFLKGQLIKNSGKCAQITILGCLRKEQRKLQKQRTKQI